MRTRACLITALLAGACRPEVGAPASLIAGPRIIAVRQEPPEVAPGDAVMAELLAVEPGGRASPDAVSWDLCVAPKPPAENNVVSRACADGPGLQPAGMGVLVALTVPVTACALHGPDTPPTRPGEPPLRPRDADVTGGYYQPFSVRWPAPGEQAFSLERIHCNLPGVSVDVAQDFGKRYVMNRNPAIAGLRGDGTTLAPVADATPALVVAAGHRVSLELSWPSEARERFPVFDVSQRQIVDHLEELVASWFVTGGTIELDRTGRGEAESETTVTNSWTAPDTAGPVHLWVVLRDNRGGNGVAQYLLIVQ
jgi:hypothetical protein